MAQHRKRSKYRVRAVFAALAVLGVGVTITTAAFTDSAVTTSTITASTVNIQAGSNAGSVGDATYTIPITVQPNGKAGWTSSQTVTIKNSGSVPIAITAAAPALSNSVTGPNGGTGTAMAGLIDASITSAAGAGVTITGGPSLFTGGKLSAMTIAAGKTYTLTPGTADTVTIVLSGDLANTYQGASIQFNWTLSATPA